MIMRYPGFKYKAVTLSYDDGRIYDYKLVEILNKYGLKGTFNLNSSLLDDENHVKSADVKDLYVANGHEVAVHGYRHLSLKEIDTACAVNDIIQDRTNLERLTGQVVKGMAYANGSFNDNVVDILKQCGIMYSRTVESTHDVELPEDWFRMPTTCHHSDSRLMEIVKDFNERELGYYYWWQRPRLFYLWGHSYEFNANNNWNIIEEFSEYIGNKEDIWYATNGEIYDYCEAFKRLRFSVDGYTIYNPSAIDVYIFNYGKNVIIPSGKTICIK